MKFASKVLFNATLLIAVALVAINFYSYIYYKSFCAWWNFSGHGLTIPLQEYYCLSWKGLLISILTIFVIIVGGIFFYAIQSLISDYLKKRKLKKHNNKKSKLDVRESDMANGVTRKSAPEWELILTGFIFIAAISFLAYYMLLGAQMFVTQDAQEEAQNIRKRRQAIIVYDMNNNAVSGDYFYLRDFGSALAVWKFIDHSKDRIAIRLFQREAYSSYSLDCKDHFKSTDKESPQIPSGNK